MPKKNPHRKQLFVDPKVQGALIGRVILYWVVCLITITLMLLCWRIVTGPARMFWTHFDDMWFHFGPALIASFVLLPLIVLDLLKLSNRFVGPLVRLRRGVRALTAGEHVEPIKFREGDFWHDFAEEFNALAAKVQEGTSPSPQSDPYEQEPVGAGAE